jgi:hypothetical protein
MVLKQLFGLTVRGVKELISEPRIQDEIARMCNVVERTLDDVTTRTVASGRTR